MNTEQMKMDEYDQFVEKFKPKKTTDDCYTPPTIYDVVADWVAAEYGLDKASFVRPFWPGGDYEREEYPDGCVVVDNPPFSILKQIRNFYAQHGVRYFLFTPARIFRSIGAGTLIAVGVSVEFENGAIVPMNFETNMMPEIALRTAPDLYKALSAEVARLAKAKKRSLPKYEYPDEVLTAATAERWCKYGVDFTLRRADCFVVGGLDDQKRLNKTIFGGGALLSERAAAERWTLSERERRICALLGKKERRAAK